VPSGARVCPSRRGCSHPIALTLAPTADWFGVAQRHKGLQYPDLIHWSQQPDWVNNDDNYELTNEA
jgi:hypothetical protein